MDLLNFTLVTFRCECDACADDLILNIMKS